MKYVKTYENYNDGSSLIIVDVQKSFRKFYSEMYLHELKEYCKSFNNVYQIWDNHVDGKSVDKDYLYDKNPDIPVNGDLYTFPNQRLLIEKRYLYDVDVTFFRKVLDKNIYNQIKEKEDKKLLKKGDFFSTKYGTIIVFIGNKHNWMHIGLKLLNFLKSLSGKEVTICGGASGECLDDIITTAISLGVKINQNFKFTYSATHCPI